MSYLFYLINYGKHHTYREDKWSFFKITRYSCLATIFPTYSEQSGLLPKFTDSDLHSPCFSCLSYEVRCKPSCLVKVLSPHAHSYDMFNIFMERYIHLKNLPQNGHEGFSADLHRTPTVFLYFR